MKMNSKTAIAALLLAVASFAGQAQAHTQWRFPHKSAPYAVPHTHPNGEYKVRSRSDCPRTVIIRGGPKGATTLVCPVK